LFCNYEKIDTLKRNVLFSNNHKADTTVYLTNEKSHSEHYSIKLTTDKPFNTSHIINDIREVKYLKISVWCFCTEKQANIVATSGKDFYTGSNTYIIEEPSGWKKIALNFWVPQGIETNHFSVYLWNAGTEPVYFDDLEIIKYKTE